MQAGDLVIWRSLLPHGTGRNHSTKPRLAQYISMFPAPAADEARRKQRIELWGERKSPAHELFPGDPRQWEIKRGASS